MAIITIGSISGAIIFRSLYIYKRSNLFKWLVGIFDKINGATRYIQSTVLFLAANIMGEVVVLYHDTLHTIKLNPKIGLHIQVYPRPVQVLYIFQGFSDLLVQILIILQGLFDLLIQILIILFY